MPSTTGLIAFQEVARCGSFTIAATRLGMTQSAVSKQIKTAETALGCALIARSRSGLRLTDAGARYLADITPHLEGLAQASRGLSAHMQAKPVVRLRALASFCDKWLLPRLAEFGQRHPEISIEFSSLLLISDSRFGMSDLEIRFGQGPWPGLKSAPLVGREIALVASPAFLKRHVIHGAADVEKLPRLAHVQAFGLWNQFASLHGLSMAGENPPTNRFEIYSVLISAAVMGLGIALVPECLVAHEMESGALVALEFGALTSADSYHLVWDEKLHSTAAITSFKTWLMAMAMQGPGSERAHDQ